LIADKIKFEIRKLEKEQYDKLVQLFYCVTKMVLLTHGVTERPGVAKYLTKNVFAYNKTKEYIKNIPDTMFAKLDHKI
jgi:hypothetical protein